METKIELNKKNIISKIILENYERFFELKKSLIPSQYHDNILKTIDKLKLCKDVNLGFAEYICPQCSEIIKIAFSCKSKFCNSCGKVYADKWIQKQKELFLDVNHRHMVFTIPDKFRMAIYKNFHLLKKLSNSISSIILYSLNSSFKNTKNIRKLKSNTKGIVKPAIISVLHTFGRDLKFNPHFHVIVACGGFKNDGSFKKVNYFNYDGLRFSWRKLFLDTIKKHFPNNNKYKQFINYYYNNNSGFYVRAKDDIDNIDSLNQYLGRYLSRPPISAKNIISYTKDTVTFKYKDHKTNKEVIETIDTLKFLGRLFYHILPKYFKSIRRYGAYARNLGEKFNGAVKSLRKFTKFLFRKYKNLSFVERFKKYFGISPLTCPKCYEEMFLLNIWHHKYGVISGIFSPP
jgi:hypothetical protein